MKEIDKQLETCKRVITQIEKNPDEYKVIDHISAYQKFIDFLWLKMNTLIEIENGKTKS